MFERVRILDCCGRSKERFPFFALHKRMHAVWRAVSSDARTGRPIISVEVGRRTTKNHAPTNTTPMSETILAMKKSRSLTSLESSSRISPSPKRQDDHPITMTEKRHGTLPPPVQFVERYPNSYHLSVTISAMQPFHILNTSKHLCSLLQLSHEQMQGKNLSILFGLDTDRTTIFSAIKKVCADFEHKSVWIPAMTIYGQDKRKHHLEAQCFMNMDCGHNSNRQIMLRFRPINFLGSGVSNSHSIEDASMRRAMRSRLKFITGLEAHLETCL